MLAPGIRFGINWLDQFYGNNNWSDQLIQPPLLPDSGDSRPVLTETDTTRRRYLQIADQLARSIQSESMQAGDRLPSERELASRFDVSRQTVREALIALEVAGAVQIRLGSGVYVQTPGAAGTMPEYEDAPGPLEILEARKIFESEAAALAAERVGNEELQQLKERLRLMKEAANRGATEETENHDRKFHIAIAEASRNSAIATTVAYLWTLRSKSEISRFFHDKARKHGSKPNIDDHRAILKALTQRDPDAARTAMKNHIGRVYREFSDFKLG